MSDYEDKYAGSEEGAVAPEVAERATGLKGVYYNPYTQIVMLGFVCFMCPGLWNAINGLGAGGQTDARTSANSNAALYACFAGVAFFAGCVVLSYAFRGDSSTADRL
jgi:hypothetical protein